MGREEGVSPHRVAASILTRGVGLGIHKYRVARVRQMAQFNRVVTYETVAAELGISKDAAGRLLRRMVASGQLVSRQQGRRKLYSLPRPEPLR
jgi:DNA-binding transcriptional regulator PaaX